MGKLLFVGLECTLRISAADIYMSRRGFLLKCLKECTLKQKKCIQQHWMKKVQEAVDCWVLCWGFKGQVNYLCRCGHLYQQLLPEAQGCGHADGMETIWNYIDSSWAPRELTRNLIDMEKILLLFDIFSRTCECVLLLLEVHYITYLSLSFLYFWCSSKLP